MNRASYDANRSTDSPYSFSQFSHMLPYNVPIDETTGNYLQNLRFGYSALNPLYEREYLNNFSRSNYRTLQDNFAINFYATPHFTAKAWITLSQRSYESRVFVDPLSASNSAFATPQELGSLTVNGSDTFSYDANLLFMYNRNFNKHFLNFSLGGNAVETSYTVDNIKYIGFSTGALNSPNDAAQVEGKPTESKNKTRLVGMFLSGNYTYDDIYLLDLSVRLDGSSEFGSDNRVAPFWAVGAGINFHNYKFLKGNKTISRLKLRGTIGRQGGVRRLFGPFDLYDLFDIGLVFDGRRTRPLLYGQPRSGLGEDPRGGCRHRTRLLQRPPDLQGQLLRQEDHRPDHRRDDSLVVGIHQL